MNNFKINKVGPMHVSFEGIMLAEIPCYDIIPPEGYYATTNYTNSLSHTEDPGAGTTRRVSPGNYWTVDLAGRIGAYQNWSPGHMDWKIPIGWFRFFQGRPIDLQINAPDLEDRSDEGSRLLLIGDSGTYHQIFTIDENGTFKIEKHGHWLSRSTNCVITLDGRVIQERHP